MKRRDTLILLILGLLAALLASRWVTAPGYMDADYYYAGGLQIAQGRGLVEPFIWNYLDQPVSLPHPAFMYWMPLPALLAAAGMLLTGSLTFAAAQWPFILLAASLPALTAHLAYALAGRRRTALLAGGLALLPGYYLPYLLTTESFAPVMLLGTLLILNFAPPPVSAWTRLPGVLRWLVLGVLAGLLHLSRADGLLWLLALLAAAALEALLHFRQGEKALLPALDALAGLLVGYALVTGFWYGRNLAGFGALMPPGGSKSLWLTEYNQTYSAHPETLTPSAWAATGWQAVLSVRFSALWDNLKTWVGVQGSILLWPLSLAGFWALRADRRVRFGVLMWAGVLAFFSFVFPFAGARGGFFHSGAAFQPLFWAAAAVGFERLMDWGVRARGWGETRSRRMFIPALLGLLLIFTLLQFAGLVTGPDPARPRWRASWDEYRQVEAELVRLAADPANRVMVNNPPGYFAATGRSAVVVPAEDLPGTIETARYFGVSYLVLDQNVPPGLVDLYQHPSTTGDLIYLGPAGQSQLFKILYNT